MATPACDRACLPPPPRWTPTFLNAGLWFVADNLPCTGHGSRQPGWRLRAARACGGLRAQPGAMSCCVARPLRRARRAGVRPNAACLCRKLQTCSAETWCSLRCCRAQLAAVSGPCRKGSSTGAQGFAGTRVPSHSHASCHSARACLVCRTLDSALSSVPRIILSPSSLCRPRREVHCTLSPQVLVVGNGCAGAENQSVGLLLQMLHAARGKCNLHPGLRSLFGVGCTP